MDSKLIDICYKKYRKQISQSWDELASLYYSHSTGEGLRSKFKKYRKANDATNKSIMVKDEVIDEIKPEVTLSDVELKEINLKKERVKLQDLRTSINKDIRTLARKESLNDLIRESIKDLKPLEFKKPYYIHGETNEMVIQISDCHMGLTVNNEFELYNEDVFIKRLSNYMLQILKIKDKEIINKCHVCFSGDVLSGEIHPNIVRSNQYGIVEQTKRFAEYASKFIAELSVNFKEVVIHFVTGNHSRNNENKDKAQNADRYENFVIEFMKLRTVNLSNVVYEDSILDNIIAEFNVKGFYSVLAHGDMDVPKNAPSKMFSLLDKKPSFIFLGHRHMFEVITVDKCKVITGGVFVNYDEYCTNHRFVGEASQTVSIIGDNGLVCVYDCKLN